MASQEFWNGGDESQKVLVRAKSLKKFIEDWNCLAANIEEIKELYSICIDASEADGEDWMKELLPKMSELSKRIEALELQSFLAGPMDSKNAIISVHAGAGGTEACDWANMLFRMYLRWAEKNDFVAEIESINDGEEAGISKATFRLVGQNAYGYAKAERGVHRLVRISPFDANKKRHTSFCSVDVIAEIEDDVDIELDEKDIRVDTYRASGKGGQHVNKTDSAVRLTHIPTGIVVACQNERSQIKNKATALKILKSRIYEKKLDEKRSEMEKFYGEKGEIGWGYQIRSYVFQPYQMVKDLRTGTETGNVQAVMDGDINLFIDSWLRAGCPRTRNSIDTE